MNFQKQNLISLHYSWLVRDEYLFQGEVSRRIFDKNNGYQVLFMINVCALFTDLFLEKKGNIIEQKIQLELPDGVKSEKTVLSWLKENMFLL